MLFWHLERRAFSRSFIAPGARKPIRMPMIAMTTNSSMSVKPDACLGFCCMSGLAAPGLTVPERLDFVKERPGDGRLRRPPEVGHAPASLDQPGPDFPAAKREASPCALCDEQIQLFFAQLPREKQL